MIGGFLAALVRVYQLTLSRAFVFFFGPACRFEPSCSAYAISCLKHHGALRGSLLSMKRLCRCHPFHPGGYDPPPPPRALRAADRIDSAKPESETTDSVIQSDDLRRS